jgi:hypothetical protein
MAPRKKRPTKKSTRAKRRTGGRAPRKLYSGGTAGNPDTGLGATLTPQSQQNDPIGNFNDMSWGAWAGGSVGTMIGLTAVEGEDMLTDTQKVTAGYFSGGSGLLNAVNIHTGSLADSNEKYYINLTQTHPNSASAETQFSVAYAHAGGSGSQTEGGSVPGPTEAIYGQWASRLLDQSEVSGGFRISSGDQGTTPSGAKLATGVRDEDIYVLVGKRERFKDRINKKNWTIALSGSTSGEGHPGSGSDQAGASTLYLTDDSNTTAGTSTVAGPRYNIVSGTVGSVKHAASVTTYGWIYPDQGVLVFSAAELSGSIPGPSGSININSTASFVKGGLREATSSMGFAPNLDAEGDAQNAVRFANCLQRTGTYLKFRSEEDQVSVSYFCRVRAKDLNFSNNPTFVSGSYNEVANTDMWGNPQVYITGIGLYGTNNQLVAIGKLSTPLKKNFSTEATIKVKLTY